MRRLIVAWTDGNQEKWRTSQIINKEKYTGLKSNSRDERILSFLIDEKQESIEFTTFDVFKNDVLLGNFATTMMQCLNGQVKQLQSSILIE